MKFQVDFLGQKMDLDKTKEIKQELKIIPKQLSKSSVSTNQMSWKTKDLNHFPKMKNPDEKCQPKKNIVFVKTVKTGGSTLTNILSRFAVKHNLCIGRCEISSKPISHSIRKFLRDNSPIIKKFNHTSHAQRNIISEHILYNRTKLADVMPNDTIYVTQLRQPLAQLVSKLNYNQRFNVTDPVEKHSDTKYRLFPSWKQLGIPVNVTPDQVQPHIYQLEKEFDLVTITEQFDLSLLLLRRKLCWDISDIIYIPLKKATYKRNKNIDPSHKTDKQALNRRYQTLNPNAYSLYDHFNETFRNLVVKAGSDLRDELSFFQELNNNVSRYCLKYIKHIIRNSRDFLNLVNSSEVLDIPASRWGTPHTVDPIECAMMKLHKETFQDISLMKKLDLNSVNMTRKTKFLTNWLWTLSQPVHPKYGIPLPVLTNTHAYDIMHGDI